MLDTRARPALVAIAALGGGRDRAGGGGGVEQRYDAVKEVLEGLGTVTEVARRYGVTR